MNKKLPKGNDMKQTRFSLTIIDNNDASVVREFKDICKKQKKRYTNVALSLFRDYIEDYKATR
ncbi:MAG: hypothetical protein ABSA46_10170 [Thermodesulfovibrionales bacterium]|jgi:hypothetical protein